MNNSKGTNSLNAFNQVYLPNYDYNKKNLVSMIPQFDKTVSRSKNEQIDKSYIINKPDSYDPDKLRLAYNHLSLHKGPRNVIRFET